MIDGNMRKTVIFLFIAALVGFCLTEQAFADVCDIRMAPDGTVSFSLEVTSPATGVSGVQRDDVPPCTKVFRNGTLLIERNGTTYILTGTEFR